jgi:hypothetical protein
MGHAQTALVLVPVKNRQLRGDVVSARSALVAWPLRTVYSSMKLNLFRAMALYQRLPIGASDYHRESLDRMDRFPGRDHHLRTPVGMVGLKPPWT